MTDNRGMNALLKNAEKFARAAGDVIQSAAQDLDSLTIEQKSLHDYVSEVDRTAEKVIVESIRRTYPDHQILGEEFGVQGPRDATTRWILDPLDGTTNFLRGIPHYAVSIAVFEQRMPVAAVVYDPAKNELFAAVKGGGATLNQQAIEVHSRSSIRGALLSTGIPYSGTNLQRADAFIAALQGFLQCDTSGVRRLGAAALDLAYVAAGRYDGFWESNLNIWDIAAGALLVTEAGGIVSDLTGGDDHFSSGDVLAASPAVHHSMIRVTSEHYRS